MADLQLERLSLADSAACVASVPLKRPGLSHSSTGTSSLSRTSSASSSVSSVVTDVDSDAPATKISLASLLLFWQWDSSLADVTEAAPIPLRWTVGSIYDIVPGDCDATARKHVARLARGIHQTLDERFAFERYRDVEALVRLLPGCPAVHMVHALFQLILTEAFGAFESINIALRLAATQSEDGVPPDDDLLHVSIVREQATLERMLSYHEHVSAGHASPFGPDGGRVYTYTPFAAAKPFEQLESVDVAALSTLATQLHAAWTALRCATGDDDALPKLRLSRLFAIQDSMVEGAFAISGESISRLVRTLSLVPELDEIRQIGCTEPKQIGRLIRDHSSAHSIMLQIDDGTLPLSIDTLNESHAILMAEQALQNPSEGEYLLVRKGHVRRGLCYTAMTRRGPGCVAKVYAPGSIVEAEYERLLDILATELEGIIDPLRAVYISIWAHFAFASIHPYEDGNGRMARILGALPLLRVGLPPLVLSMPYRGPYLETLGEMTYANAEAADCFIGLARDLVGSTLAAIDFVRRLPSCTDDSCAPPTSPVRDLKAGTVGRASWP